MKILNIPIEPIPDRYSVDWDKWFENSFKEFNIDFQTIYGIKTSEKINIGSFLDVIETNLYKLSQTEQIIHILKEYDDQEILVLFFHDIWFPGLANIAYFRDGRNLKNLRICGCLHAGSYDENDFLNKTGMTKWARFLEIGWFNGIVDTIFVATEYHKSLLIKTRGIFENKIQVSGFPIYPDFIKKINKTDRENIIVFPHRLDIEKQPDLFDKIATHPFLKHCTFHKTKEYPRSKKEYYEFLQKSKIVLSFSKQETWGIAMQEAVLCGAFPICPARLSYPEMYNDLFLYNDIEDIPQMINKFINHPPFHSLLNLQSKILRKGTEAIPYMINIIKKYEN